MSRFLTGLVFCHALAFAAYGQDIGASFKGASLEGDVLVLKLACAPGWHVYPVDGDEGNRTIVTLDEGPRKIAGAIVQPPKKHHRKEYDSGYVEEYDYLDGEVVFRVPTAPTGKAGDAIEGKISWNACNDDGCLPLAEAAFKVATGAAAGEGVETRPATPTRRIANPKTVQKRRASDPTSFVSIDLPERAVAGEPFSVVLTTRVKPGWHIYGLKSLGGPEQPTSFAVGAVEDGPASTARLADAVTSNKTPKTKTSGADRYLSFEGEVVFTIPVVVAERPASGAESFLLTIAYQACTDESCLPPAEASFELEIPIDPPKGEEKPTEAPGLAPKTTTKPPVDPPGNLGPSSDAPVRFELRPPKPEVGREAEVILTLDVDATVVGDVRVTFTNTPPLSNTGPARLERRGPRELLVIQPVVVADYARAEPGTIEGVVSIGGVEKKFSGAFEIVSSLLNFILLAMGAAGFALLTPCVFPMIPVTVSYFTKQAEKTGGKNPWSLGFLYAFGIIASFTLIGVAFTAALGPAGASVFAQHPITQLAIAALFVVFAVSLMGAFEMQLPAFLQNMIGSAQGKGGVGGVLLMGALFSLTTFTCTAAFVGGLLAAAASSGDYTRPVLGMVAFSGVLAIPFIFLSAFPSYLKKLPRSGGWMNEVKVVMGFIELAAALKFLNGWDVDTFTRTVVIVFTTAIFAACGLYLLGVYRMPHDSPREKTSVTHVMLALGSLGLAFYLATGVGGQPLAGFIDGYLPVVEKEKDPRKREQALADAVAERLAQGGLTGKSGGEAPPRTGLDRVFDDAWPEAVAEAKRIGAPIFIDFTGFT